MEKITKLTETICYNLSSLHAPNGRIDRFSSLTRKTNSHRLLFLLQMETFDDDANLILKVVGRADNMTIHPSGSALPLSGNARAPAKRRNISLGSSAAQKTSEYLSQLTKEEVRLLYVAYYLDFTLFGFSPVDIV